MLVCKHLISIGFSGPQGEVSQARAILRIAQGQFYFLKRGVQGVSTRRCTYRSRTGRKRSSHSVTFVGTGPGLSRTVRYRLPRNW
jgi:hypothetical protein